ncbi:molybdate transport system substrate-binding protein [Marinobacter daqiaonensis]|uniref:Molybdate transport system substrate-binding protein n=1 Tax=Marinobacter daqiaonensis TaxID=650891 RepID=A0A1I6IKR2_9GAMM|nr:molybdate ABC transporter substrate-binding protein [Marinobacter daqiaonensis]SFR67367.1 molybdate transport system substrate-binding protein [Marinobacter daqiaonensis]
MRIALVFSLLMLLFSTSVHALTIAAASSLRQAMGDLEEAFLEQHPDTGIRVIFGSSGKLTAQITNGAPYDVFLSADTAYPERLVALGAAASEPAIYARGRLVLWYREPDRTNPELAGLLDQDIRRIAIAQPRHAPYGQAALEVLGSAGLWQAVKPKLVYGENVGQAAAMVASGAADAGLIAWSLTHSPELAGRSFALINEDLHSPLAMAMVITRQGADNPDARNFSNFLQTITAQDILQQYGFQAPTTD